MEPVWILYFMVAFAFYFVNRDIRELKDRVYDLESKLNNDEVDTESY